MKAKLYLMLCSVLVNQSAFCQPVYDGYETCYRTRNGLFGANSSFDIAGGTSNTLTLDGTRFSLDRARAFPREHTSVDLGHWAVGYRMMRTFLRPPHPLQR